MCLVSALRFVLLHRVFLEWWWGWMSFSIMYSSVLLKVHENHQGDSLYIRNICCRYLTQVKENKTTTENWSLHTFALHANEYNKKVFFQHYIINSSSVLIWFLFLFLLCVSTFRLNAQNMPIHSVDSSTKKKMSQTSTYQRRIDMHIANASHNRTYLRFTVRAHVDFVALIVFKVVRARIKRKAASNSVMVDHLVFCRCCMPFERVCYSIFVLLFYLFFCYFCFVFKLTYEWVWLRVQPCRCRLYYYCLLLDTDILFVYVWLSFFGL